jgi:hypothetical protein
MPFEPANEIGRRKLFEFSELLDCDLVVDAVYEGGTAGNAGDDPIAKLLPGAGNRGGFRAAGRGLSKKFVVLYSSGVDPVWPDRIDLESGRFTYYGDNKKPGHELHDTPRKGNLLLMNCFDWLHSNPNRRVSVPPFFIFQKHPTSTSSWSAEFRGLAVPGAPGLAATSDLVAVWKTTKGQRFQNYRAVFTILDAPTVSRAWIEDLSNGTPLTGNAPKAWRDWVETGHYEALTAENTITIRTVDEQLPTDVLRRSILQTVWSHFHEKPVSFEPFAAHVFQMLDGRAVVDEITRGSRDGGRDAIGRYLLGIADDPVHAEFALEAKCYQPGLDNSKPNTIGVKEVARLISRLRHRQFGVLVTTSAVSKQAYEEVREDGHPIVFISGKDIADILVDNGLNDVDAVKNLLVSQFPVSGGK